MPMLEMMLGAAIFSGACIIGAALFRGLSNREKRRQRELEENHAEYRRYSNREYGAIRSAYALQAEQMRNKSLAEMRAKIALAIAEAKIRNQKFYDKQMQLCNEQIQDVEASLAQYEEMLVEMKAAERPQGQLTALRRNSIQQVRQNFEESKAYYRTLRNYLQKWQSCQERTFDRYGTLLEPFALRLPDQVPYKGRLLFCHREDLAKGEFSLHVQTGIDYSAFCEDAESLPALDNKDAAEKLLPVLVVNNRKQESKKGKPFTSYVVSYQKGRLIALLREQPDIALEATIVRYEKNKWGYQEAILNYQGVEMIYRPQRSKRLRRKLPRGAKLRVYVTFFSYDMSRIIASNMPDGDFSPDVFHNIPLLFQPGTENDFLAQVQKQHLDESLEDWQIGPYTQNMDEGLVVKCQLGTRFVFAARWKALPFGVDTCQYGLVFEKMLDAKDAFSLEDSYVLIDADLHMRYITSLADDGDEQAAWGKASEVLYLYLSQEFLRQARIKAGNKEAVYFNHWSRLMNELCAEKEKGSHYTRCTLEITAPEGNDEQMRYVSVQADCVEQYRKKCDKWLDKQQKGKKEARRWHRPEFFVLISGDNGVSRRVNVNFTDDNEEMYFVYDKISRDELARADGELTVYLCSYPYPEYQQRNALEAFRLSNMTNPKLKEVMFNLSNEYFDYNDRQIASLQNPKLHDNLRQMQAVACSVAANGMFFIQGPPGTGKTTVIREIVVQELRAKPSAHVLVVSQSNVAVDNVLRGFLHDECFGQLMVRCGNKENIAEDLQGHDFFKKLHEYQAGIRQELPGELQQYRAMWRGMLEDKDEEILINEYLLADFQVVGVTCVGLANQQFGLEKSEFDLVVIDEAGKAMPGELLLPINRARKVVIIGDHKQLPPVVDPILCSPESSLQAIDVLSEDERAQFLEQSLFQRLYKGAHKSNKIMLDVQFRMPQIIGDFISKYFYDGMLRNAPLVKDKMPLFLRNNLVLVDVCNDSACHEQKTADKKGLVNYREAEVVAQLVRRLRKFYDGRIVIITPYKRQKRIIREALSFLQEPREKLNVDTVDSFQGDEAPVVIYSTTRTRYCTNFFSDYARINVAMSRTNNMLFVVASSQYLRKYKEVRADHVLPALADYIEENGVVLPVKQLWNDHMDWKWNPAAMMHKSEQRLEHPAQEVTLTTEEFMDLLPDEQEAENSSSEDEKLVPCKKCGAMHPASVLTEGLCPLCLQYSGEAVKCHACGKEWIFTNYQKYVLHETRPYYCEECAMLDLHYSCERCGNDIHVNPEWHRKMLFQGQKPLRFCKKCRDEVVERRVCRDCGQEFEITGLDELFMEEKRREGIDWSLPTRCKACRCKKHSNAAG